MNTIRLSLQELLRRFDAGLDKKLMWRLLRDNFKKHAVWYAIAIASMMVVAGATSLSAWMMRDIVDGLILTKNIEKVFGFAAIVIIIFAVKGAATFLQGYYLSRAGNSIIAEQQRKIYDRILKQGVSFFNEMPSAELLIRITHNAQAARGVVDAIVTSAVRDFLSVIGLLVVMLIQQPLLSIISFSIGPIALLGIRRLVAKARHFMSLELASIGTMVTAIQETSAGIKVIKSFSLEDLLRCRMERAISDVEKQSNRIARLESATSPIMETLGGFAIGGVIAASGFLVLQRGHTPGELMSFITALLLAYEPAKRLARVRITLEAGMVGVRSMFDLLDRPISLEEHPDAIDLPEGPGAITFERVNFRYQAERPIFQDLNLSFDAGKKIALVGPSGGGKTTIINLIMRLYEPDNGAIRIDRVDIRDVSFKLLRKRISFVGQDAFLFAGTIKFNISVGREGATDKDIIAAAKAANAHDFIMQLPHGYDTDVGEAGGKLSGGQKQRLTIARAMLHDGEILILDEPTSALDAEAEAAVRDALNRLMAGRTTIIVAHRLSTIIGCDKIIFIENGSVIEQGTNSELLQMDGRYRRLFEHQFATGTDELAGS